ncbi:MAG TPA: hypothetical protein PKE40_08410 [Arachnia sp.]|nr:hypothetical protein [Arachnia sp.]HMT86359.1 hypothetical protein [Arachnia sp.]
MISPDELPDAPPRAQHHPLGEGDPAKVGTFWLHSRLAETPAGVVYGAHEDDGDPVMLILLSEGAAADHAARARFAGEINAMHIDTVVARGGQGQDDGPMGVRFRDEDDDPHLTGLRPLAPWAALAFDGTVVAVFEAVRVLRAVDLLSSPPLSEPAGPDYRLHWIDERSPGASRVWALAWPGRHDRAGWITILVSWLLMILLAALALLLAILVFQNAPLVSPPPPVPTDASGEGSGDPTSGPPQSGEPTSGQPQSGDPSEGEGASSPGNAPPSRLGTPTMTDPSGDASGPGDPTPNKRL